jgi:hypothetical protein
MEPPLVLNKSQSISKFLAFAVWRFTKYDFQIETPKSQYRNPERVQCKSQILFQGFGYRGFGQRKYFDHFSISPKPESLNRGFGTFCGL